LPHQEVITTGRTICIVVSDGSLRVLHAQVKYGSGSKEHKLFRIPEPLLRQDLRKVGDTGLEPVAQNPTKTVHSVNSAAESYAVDANRPLATPELELVIEAWDSLPEATKIGILAMVRASRDPR
jgi:hypothetical protein